MNRKNLLNKFLLILILVFTTFITTACDLLVGLPGVTQPAPNPGSGGGTTNPSIEVPKDDFPAIPVYKQSNAMTEEEMLGSNFFSSKSNYYNVGADTRFVNLKEQKTIYIRYESNLDSDVKKSLDAVITYLQKVFKIDSSYKLVYDSGTPGVISDLFCYDTIYIKNPDNRAKQDFADNTVAGITYRAALNSPVIYINKSANTLVVNGKNISMTRTILHEIMHGFGFNHSKGVTDLMFDLQLSFEKYGDGTFFYRNEEGTQITVKDYFYFSNTELGGLLEYLAPGKSYAEKLSVYKNIGGTFPDLNGKFLDMKTAFLQATRSQSVTSKSPDIILTIKLTPMK